MGLWFPSYFPVPLHAPCPGSSRWPFQACLCVALTPWAPKTPALLTPPSLTPAHPVLCTCCQTPGKTWPFQGLPRPGSFLRPVRAHHGPRGALLHPRP